MRAWGEDMGSPKNDNFNRENKQLEDFSAMTIFPDQRRWGLGKARLSRAGWKILGVGHSLPAKLIVI